MWFDFMFTSRLISLKASKNSFSLIIILDICIIFLFRTSTTTFTHLDDNLTKDHDLSSTPPISIISCLTTSHQGNTSVFCDCWIHQTSHNKDSAFKSSEHNHLSKLYNNSSHAPSTMEKYKQSSIALTRTSNPIWSIIIKLIGFTYMKNLQQWGMLSKKMISIFWGRYIVLSWSGLLYIAMQRI